jgi:hypothetical protein
MSQIGGIGTSKENADNFIRKKSSYDIKAICNNGLDPRAHHTVKIFEHGKYNKNTGVKK